MLDSFWTISMGAGLVIGLIGFAVAGKGGATLGGMVQFGFFATCCTFAPRRVLANPRIAATIGTTNLKVARAVCAIAMTICGSMAVLVLAGLLLDSKGPVADQGEKPEEVRVAEYRARVEMQRARAAESPAPVPGEIPSSAPPGESLPPPPVTDGALQVSDFALEATTRNPLNVTFVMRIQGGRGKNRDVWGGIGDLEVIKRFATQAKGPMANRLGLLELNGPGFYIAPCKEWNPVPEKPGLSRCRLNFEKVALSRSSALVSVIVFDDEGGVALQTSQVDFETGKAEAEIVSRAEGGR